MKIKIWKDLIRSSRFHQILKNDLDKQTIPPFSLRTGNSRRKLSSIPRLQSAHWENLSTQKLLEISNCFRKIFQPLQRCVNQTEQKSPDKKHSCKSVLEQQKEPYSHYSCYWWALEIFILTLSWKWVIFDFKITKHQNMRARNFNFCISQFSDQTWAKIFAALRFEMWFFVFGFAKLPMPIKSNQIVLQPNSIPEGEAIKGSWTKWQKYL